MTKPDVSAPFCQAVIVPIWKKEEEKAAVLQAGADVQKKLAAGGVRVKLDANEQRTPGWKFNFWEMKVGRVAPFGLKLGEKTVFI